MVNSKNLEEIYELYNSRISNVIKRFFQSSSDTEDIKQEVFIKTWKNLSKYRGDASLWSWLNKITVNTCKDHLRSAKNIQFQNQSEEDDLIHNIQDDSPGPEKLTLFTERHRLILNSVNKLNPKLKEVIIMHDIDELTYEEISKRINCPIGTVKSRLFNARKALRADLNNLIN